LIHLIFATAKYFKSNENFTQTISLVYLVPFHQLRTLFCIQSIETILLKQISSCTLSIFGVDRKKYVYFSSLCKTFSFLGQGYATFSSNSDWGSKPAFLYLGFGCGGLSRHQQPSWSDCNQIVSMDDGWAKLPPGDGDVRAAHDGEVAKGTLCRLH
jgi:hypothetical protein